MSIDTVEAYERWKIESDILKKRIRLIEDAQHRLLQSLKCPTDPLALYDILDGKRTEPWPKLKIGKKDRSAEERKAAIEQHRQRTRMRVQHAMFVLLHLRDVRTHTALGKENARQAATSALLAGIYAGDGAANAIEAEEAKGRRQKGGKLTAEKKAATRHEHDDEIWKHYRRWQDSDELQDKHRSAASYVESKYPKVSRSTIERTIARISGLNSRQ